jgi:hypothetical protein
MASRALSAYTRLRSLLVDLAALARAHAALASAAPPLQKLQPQALGGLVQSLLQEVSDIRRDITAPLRALGA